MPFSHRHYIEFIHFSANIPQHNQPYMHQIWNSNHFSPNNPTDFSISIVIYIETPKQTIHLKPKNPLNFFHQIFLYPRISDFKIQSSPIYLQFLILTDNTGIYLRPGTPLSPHPHTAGTYFPIYRLFPVRREFSHNDRDTLPVVFP